MNVIVLSSLLVGQAGVTYSYTYKEPYINKKIKNSGEYQVYTQYSTDTVTENPTYKG